MAATTKQKTPHAGTALPMRYGLGLALRGAYRAFVVDFQARLATLGFTHTEFLYLSLLYSYRSLTPSDLASRTGVQNASATNVIKLLSVKGLIDKRKDTADSRKINIVLTAKGVRATEDLLECAVVTNDKARTDFSDAEFRELRGLLHRITKNLKAGKR